MSESFLSFGSSAQFRNTLIARNLAPYSVPGVFAPQSSNINYETNLTITNVVDSPNNLVATNTQANILYPLNEYGPDGGFQSPIGLSNKPLTIESNKGPYDPNDTIIDLVNEFYIDAAFIQNSYGPQGGYNSLVSITDIVKPGKIYLPYWEPPTFAPSSYSPYDILTSSNPTGSNGSLSQDSYIAKIGATQLKTLFEERIAAELTQATIGRVNLDSLTDPFSASLIASGQQPLIEKNWKITQPESPVLAAVSLANRLTGTYFPVSFIPGDYFDSPEPKTSKVEGGLNVINNLTGGALGPILNKYRNPSEIFLSNTGNGQKSTLFSTLDYNKYRPDYNRGIGQSVKTGLSNLLNSAKPNKGGYYVGSSTLDPSKVESPPNQLPVNSDGQQLDTLVYGPSELGILYEGNENKLNFGLKGKSYTNSGAIDGEFVWTSPKYKDNAGFYVAPGGATTSVDNDFNVVEANYNKNKSTNITFKEGSILDQTQRIINSADNLQGEARLKHVGTAMNQVSKVFNDGYKEITKGSQVLRYTDNTNGTEAGIEYCRIFQKDTPYFTYSDLQKTDGITKSGRKFTYSVFDNTYNLNIAPLRGVDSTNIFDNKVKKYMFSIENLAWRTSDRPGYTYNDLPACERGPNGGRIMWFPPYDISFSDDSKPDFGSTSFLGRPEPIYTYKNTSRSGSLKWKIIVDSPASLNTIIEKQLANTPKERLDSIIDSFFAGCTKYDLYELGIKFNTIPTRDLYTYQELLNNPRLTSEEFGQIVAEIPVTNTDVKEVVTPQSNGGNDNKTASNEVKNPFENLEGLGFYFAHNIPGGEGETASEDFETYYNQYLSDQPNLIPPNETILQEPGGAIQKFTKQQGVDFYDKVVKQNFSKLSKDIIKNINDILSDNGIVTLTLQGAASAPGGESNNLALSKRRISAVEKWLRKQKDNNGIEYEKYIGKRIILNSDPQGEKIVLPKGADTFDQSINCNVQPKELVTPMSMGEGPSNLPPTEQITQDASRNSVPAIACRRVQLKASAIQFPKETEKKTTESPKEVAKNNTPLEVNLTSTTKKPIPQVDVKQKIKEGISKKVLRQLFSECDYFQVIKETNPMVYDSFKEKIKYFSPAFHSSTPEGLNSRLTFLNQCMRPGQTIPVIGPDGRPKYNDALNTAFGAPPILVLRVGDFYHSKIVPTSLSITYEPLLFDMNPEGIGIQPMMASVTLAFNFIGGMGLKEPVEQLQNALSFNYYANTEVYDERATATEDTSARDKYVVEQILNNQKPVAPVENPPPKKGEDTIGTILSTTPISGTTNETGEIEYTSLMSELSDQTNKYFKTIFNQLKTIQNTTNYGILQLVGFERKYSKGDLCFFSDKPNRLETQIYGKPEGVEGRIEKLKDRAIEDIRDKKNPINIQFSAVPNVQLKSVRAVQEFLKTTIRAKQSELNQIVIGPINEMTKFQENYTYTFKKMDAVIYNAASTGTTKSGVDGKKLQTGENKIYEIIELENQSNFDKMLDQYKNSVRANLSKFDTFIESKYITNKTKFIEDSSTFKPLINDTEMENNDTKRYYMLMCDTFVNDAKYNVFREGFKNIREIRENPFEQTQLLKILDNLQILFKKEFDAEKKLFSDLEVSPEYKSFETFKLDKIDTKFKYTTDYQDVFKRQEVMRRVYSTTNDNLDSTFNIKVKFN